MNDITIYHCKDDRLRVYIKNEKRVMSYPKFFMEQRLGRKLESHEQVHHIDENPLNNDISNLKLMRLGEHQSVHVKKKYFDKEMICPECGKHFIWTAKSQIYHYGKMKYQKDQIHCEQPFCSHKCAGRYIRRKQINGDYTRRRDETGSTYRT